jgi:hypothetical protein
VVAAASVMLLSLPAASDDSKSGATAKAEAETKSKTHVLPRSEDGDLVLGLCDGETTLELDGVKEGSTLTRAQAQAASDTLMAKWLQKNPNARWEVAQASAKQQPPPERGTTPAQGASQIKQPGTQEKVQAGHTYGSFTQRDEEIWRASTQEFVDRGHKVFHDAKELGSPIAVSCDMCHPDGSNTHPETYPKYQVQLGRVALLRDMINWCIENPVRGKPLHEDDERLRAMEAYIFAKRKGVPLEFGKK